jgi:uncharacterized SAM-binding protein YcdF (DUF218 family)
VLWSYCFSTPGIARALLNSLERRHPLVREPSTADAPLIVVLSSGYPIRRDDGYQSNLDLAGWERTWAGITLWRKVGGRLLFVGAPTPDGKSSVAAFMAEIATNSGVPPGAVAVETKSRNTYQNLAFTREMIASHPGLAWLVTSAVHMPRAMAVARKLGIRLHPYPCDYRASPLQHWYAWLPNSGGPSMFAQAFHEIVGRLYYRMKGYAD